MIYLGDKMTEKQREILEIIKDFIVENGYPPTVREIGKIANLSSTSTVFVHLMNLEKGGYISMLKGKSRTIRIIKDEDIWVQRRNNIKN